MVKNGRVTPFLPISFLFFFTFLGSFSLHGLALKPKCPLSVGPMMVARDQRRTVACTDSGRISAVRVVDDGHRGPYHLQFITLDPNSLLLPVLLHMDMVFYVHSGRGSVGWAGEEEEMNHIDVERGDIYRLGAGSIFYVRSYSEPPLRERLRIYAFFDTINNDNAPVEEAFFGPYSNLSDLVRGFDEKVLQMGFAVSEEVIQTIKWAAKPPPIVHFAPNETERPHWKRDIFAKLIEGGNSDGFFVNSKKKKTKTFNIFEEKPDVENCNGWSIAVTNKDFRGLKGSNVGVFMVNLTRGSMMGPHWNPMATEIAIVTHGQGMVQVVFPTNPSGGDNDSSKSTSSVRFRVKEGDVFVVPRYHPMAQMSFNNDSLVFVGFSTLARNNHPQFLVGKRSVMRVLDRQILAVSFNVTNATVIDELLNKQRESIILECASCAEEEERVMEEEIQRQRQEEEARRREEEEEEARKRDEEARKREEEERRREEEEARKREEQEERRKREEEEARRREEEEARKREEEESREEEEARKREKEEERRKRKEEARKIEEEEERKREEEERREKEEARRREEEEIREEEEAKKKEEQKERAKRREEERQREEEEEESRKQQEEERQGGEEERWEREQGEEEWRREQEERRARRHEKEEEEEWRREQEEEEETRRKEEGEVFSWRKMLVV